MEAAAAAEKHNATHFLNGKVISLSLIIFIFGYDPSVPNILNSVITYIIFV